MCTGFWCLDISGAVQIGFWLVAGTLAVLTYRQAKRSLFQPLRVEVFKLQLAVLGRVNDLFALKQEVALRDHFDLNGIVGWNSRLMAEAFIRLQFGLKPKEGKSILDRHKDVLVGAVFILPENSEDREIEGFELVTAPQPGAVPPEPVVEPAWADYTHQPVHITAKYAAAVDEIETLMRDPLLPTDLRVLLEELVEAVQKNVRAVKVAMETAAETMPEAYPDLDHLEGESFGWVDNIWNRKIVPLEPIGEKIVAFVRGYFETEKVGYARIPKTKQAKASRDAAPKARA